MCAPDIVPEVILLSYVSHNRDRDPVNNMSHWQLSQGETLQLEELRENFKSLVSSFSDRKLMDHAVVYIIYFGGYSNSTHRVTDEVLVLECRELACPPADFSPERFAFTWTRPVIRGPGRGSRNPSARMGHASAIVEFGAHGKVLHAYYCSISLIISMLMVIPSHTV